MNASASLVYAEHTASKSRFSEIDEVRLTRAATTSSGRVVPPGTIGTVMLVLADGAAYEVEFGETLDDLLTIDAAHLEPAPAVK